MFELKNNYYNTFKTKSTIRKLRIIILPKFSTISLFIT